MFLIYGVIAPQVTQVSQPGTALGVAFFIMLRSRQYCQSVQGKFYPAHAAASIWLDVSEKAVDC